MSADSFETVFKRYEQHLSPGIAALTKFMGLEVAEDTAQGAHVYGPDGDDFLDCLGGPGVFTFGHRHPQIVAAVKEQLDRMPLSSHILLDPVRAEAAEKICDITPGDIQYIFFCNSGAEAVEGALKAARAYTGRPEFVSMDGAFHGKTFGALAASGRDVYREPFEPLMAGFTHVAFGDTDALAGAVTDQTAAVIIEPVQCENGIQIPPDGFLSDARQICDDNGAMLIFDEVQTGMGRTGRRWGCDHEAVVPDIISLGKALGGGVMPIGAFAARAEVWEMFAQNPYVHSSTFGGNPLACAAASAAVDVLIDEDIATQCEQKGQRLLAGIQQVGAEFSDVIEDVRGRGLLVGVEFVDSDIASLVIAQLIGGQILTAFTLNEPKVVRLEPPACITDDEVDHVIEVFQQAAASTTAMLDM
ncbi:MAG: aminotransferase class III-fold pyridoxal phosphate-dependent enzyme [Armatimonadota bacterium]